MTTKCFDNSWLILKFLFFDRENETSSIESFYERQANLKKIKQAIEGIKSTNSTNSKSVRFFYEYFIL